MLSKYYANLLENDKKQIAKNLNNSNDYLLGQCLHVLSIQRNICAHFGYLYQRDYAIRPIMAKSFHWDPNENGKLFAQFLVMRRLGDKKNWHQFMSEFERNVSERQFFELADYGFPNDWSSYLS